MAKMKGSRAAALLPLPEIVAERRDEMQAEMQRMIESMVPRSAVPLPAQVLQARRNAEARHELLQEFGAFKSADIGEAAGSKASNRGALAHRWKSDGRVFSVVHNGAAYFPGFQFTPDGKPLTVVGDLLAILANIRPGWELALWFTASNGWLGGKRPVDLLVTSPEAVLDAARHEAEELVF